MEQDSRYNQLVAKLRQAHAELLRENLAENPVKIGEYLGNLRLNANMLFAFINFIIKEIDQSQIEVAKSREAIYLQNIKDGKSQNAAETDARERTRVEESKVKSLEYKLQLVKNEYERYNGICMYLQSRLKEFNTERMVN